MSLQRIGSPVPCDRMLTAASIRLMDLPPSATGWPSSAPRSPVSRPVLALASLVASGAFAAPSGAFCAASAASTLASTSGVVGGTPRRSLGSSRGVAIFFFPFFGLASFIVASGFPAFLVPAFFISGSFWLCPALRRAVC